MASSSSGSRNADKPVPVQPARTPSLSLLGDELISTVDEIVQRCPQFRILVMGKSGAGKSSLINAAFDVDLATVSHDIPGISDINQEITSKRNPRFVLHDSQGFAAGEVNNFRIVEKFIRERTGKPDVKDRLHAIWSVLSPPRSRNPDQCSVFPLQVLYRNPHRRRQSLDLKFLDLHIANVPIIVVFTKYDRLVRKFEYEFGSDDTKIDEAVEAAFQKTCMLPLQDATLAHPYVKVSKKPEYEETLDELVKLTQKNVDDAVWLIWAVAQRASADVSIQASIAIGKKKYWSALVTAFHFPGKTLQRCLRMVHQDIVMVWNFDDTNSHLLSTEFRALMTHLVDDLDDRSPPTNRNSISAPSVTAIAVVVSGVIPPAAPIAIPVAVGIVFAQWVYTVYIETPAILGRLMAYIVDLTIVMQSLFWLMQSRGGTSPVPRRLVKLAFNAYLESADRTDVHNEIRKYVRKKNVFTIGKRDKALEEVVRLIRTRRFVPEAVYKDKARNLSAGDLDEAWEMPRSLASGGTQEDSRPTVESCNKAGKRRSTIA